MLRSWKHTLRGAAKIACFCINDEDERGGKIVLCSFSLIFSNSFGYFCLGCFHTTTTTTTTTTTPSHFAFFFFLVLTRNDTYKIKRITQSGSFI